MPGKPKTDYAAIMSRKTRWLRINDLPFGRGFAYRLIGEGVLFSVELTMPGSGRSVRLVDAESLDEYLTTLGKEQQKQQQQEEAEFAQGQRD